MSDLTTRWNIATGTGDWSLSIARSLVWTDQNGNAIVDQAGQLVSASFTPGDGLQSGDDLLTAVLISLFTDAQAGVDDAIVDGSTDPRGWWAGPIGSRIWLRLRSKATPIVLALVRDDIAQALGWLIDDGVAAAIDVETEWTKPNLLGARVLIRRTDGTRRVLQFAHLWESI